MGASHAINSHDKAFSVFSERVWFGGDGALNEGQGVCYNWDSGTATVADGRRGNHVELPTILNAVYFAGVADRPYTAHTGGQFITINQPGSFCNIWSGANNTIGASISTCSSDVANSGVFVYAGFQGRGSAVPLQTIDRSTPGVCFAYLQTGRESGLVQLITSPVIGTAITGVGIYGMTVFDTVGQAEMTGAHTTFTVADGTSPDQRKGFRCIVDCGNTYDFVMTINGIQVDGSTALQTLVLDDIGDESIMTWNLDWYENARVGASVT